MIVEQLCEIFPHLHNYEIPLKVNQYLIESVNNNEKEIDFVFAVNEIRQQILNTGPTRLFFNQNRTKSEKYVHTSEMVHLVHQVHMG